MPLPEGAQLPLEILIKGSISNFIKVSSPLNSLPQTAAAAPTLCSEQKSIEKPANKTEVSGELLSGELARKQEPEQICEDTFECARNSNSPGFLKELKKLCFKRIFVRTQQSGLFDGILTEVSEEFMIIINARLSVVTIPLSGIVSFHIINP